MIDPRRNGRNMRPKINTPTYQPRATEEINESEHRFRGFAMREHGDFSLHARDSINLGFAATNEIKLLRSSHIQDISSHRAKVKIVAHTKAFYSR